jgi:hypothetical protein
MVRRKDLDVAAKKKTKRSTAKPKGKPKAKVTRSSKKKAAPKGGSSKKGAKKVGRAVKAKKKTGVGSKAGSKKTGTKKTSKKVSKSKLSTKKVATKKTAAKKTAAKKTAAKKKTTKKAVTKKSVAKKGATKKTNAKKSLASSGSSKAARGAKLTAKGILAKRAEAKKAEARKAAAKKSASKKTTAKKVKKVALKKVTVVGGSPKKGASKKVPSKTKLVVETKPTQTKTPQTSTPAPKQRSQPVEVQEIDVRGEREQHKRLPSYRPKSYGKKPKPVPAGEILKVLSKFLGKAPTFKRELKGLPLVHLGMYCVFAVGGNPPKVCLEAVKRLVEAFPDWNEFRISDPLEFVEILEDLKIENLYHRCERVLDFINDVYQDQNGVDLEFLRESDSEDRLTILDRYVSLGPALAHFLALGIQGFEGVLFHYSWARVVQRLGIVPRSGSPKTLVASLEKVFRGKDIVTAQVNLIDLGEEICLSKNQSCRTCYLVLHCKGRKI